MGKYIVDKSVGTSTSVCLPCLRVSSVRSVSVTQYSHCFAVNTIRNIYHILHWYYELGTHHKHDISMANEHTTSIVHACVHHDSLWLSHQCLHLICFYISILSINYYNTLMDIILLHWLFIIWFKYVFWGIIIVSRKTG